MVGIKAGLAVQPLHRSSTLDAIRGVAILQVVTFHYFFVTANFGWISRTFFGMTWSGVDLFFVLSGFLIGGIIIDQRQSPNFYTVFYARRALRILPLYTLCIGLYILALVLARRPVDGLWAYATFTQNILWAAQGQWGPYGTIVTWSLAVEEQFYLILPLLIRLCPPQRLPLFVIGLICAAPVLRGVALAVSGRPLLGLYILFPCRMDALFVGVLVAWAVRHPAIVTKFRNVLWLQPVVLPVLWLGFAGLLLGAPSFLSIVMQSIGFSWIALTYGITLLCIVLHPKCDPISSRYLFPLSCIGLAAYAIYLIHFPLQQILVHVSGSDLIASLAATVMVSGLAAVSWRLIERPLIEFGRRRFRYRNLSMKVKFLPNAAE